MVPVGARTVTWALRMPWKRALSRVDVQVAVVCCSMVVTKDW